MIVREDGLFFGSSSAGCVEIRAIEVAHNVITSGKPEVVTFDPTPECDVLETGYTCGQRIRLLVEPVQEPISVSPGSVKIRPSDTIENEKFEEIKQEVLRSQTSRTAVVDGKEYFFQYFPRRSRLIIVGAVHIAVALAKFAFELGMDVVVIDPRSVFLEPERFAATPCLALLGWPDSIMPTLEISNSDAIVTLSHDDKIDDLALTAALATPARYIAALGSTKTHEKRLLRLADSGMDSSSLSRINGPAGMKIGAVSPEEIAISILGQIISQFSPKKP